MCVCGGGGGGGLSVLCYVVRTYWCEGDLCHSKEHSVVLQLLKCTHSPSLP